MNNPDGGGYGVKPSVLGEFAYYLGQLGDLGTGTVNNGIYNHAVTEGLNPDGLEGSLLSPLTGILDTAHTEFVSPAFLTLREMFCDAGDGVLQAARAYGEVDDDVGRSISEVMDENAKHRRGR